MRLWLILGIFAAGCSSSDDGPPLTNATSLGCPYPGDLPFRLPTSGFQKPVNADTVKTELQSKDRAFDILGDVTGPYASVDLADTASVAQSTTPVTFDGGKARTTPTAGLLADSLPGEHVSVWSYDPGAAGWQVLGTGVTDDAGRYTIAPTKPFPGNVNLDYIAATGQPIYAMLDADGSCAVHTSYFYDAATKVVVVDIDGTLTTDDNQILMQGTDETYVPKMMTAANQLTQAWKGLGYPVIYLTARPHLLQAESHEWLDSQMFAQGPLITEGGTLTADAYKTLWLQRITHDFGWQVVAAYGNAQTDITAYAAVGIPAEHTFIIGPLAGAPNTTPIPNMDYTAHIQSYVMAQPGQAIPF